jgi:hypothetical protein
MPSVPDGVAAWLGGVCQQRREPHRPPVDADVVDLDPALGEQLFDVAIGQPEAQVPADSQHDHVGWKAEAGECGVCSGRRARVAGCDTAVSLIQGGRSERNSAMTVHNQRARALYRSPSG